MFRESISDREWNLCEIRYLDGKIGESNCPGTEKLREPFTPVSLPAKSYFFSDRGLPFDAFYFQLSRLFVGEVSITKNLSVFLFTRYISNYLCMYACVDTLDPNILLPSRIIYLGTAFLRYSRYSFLPLTSKTLRKS